MSAVAAMPHGNGARYRRVASLVAGAGTTALIFSVLSQLHRIGQTKEHFVTDDLRIHSPVLPPPPPPPPAIQNVPASAPSFIPTDALPVPGAITFRASPAQVEIKASPAPNLRVETSFAAFRAGTADANPKRVFDKSDVDRVPVPIVQPSPQLTWRDYIEMKNRSMKVLFVVEVDGSVKGIQSMNSTGSERVDQLVLRTLARWKFHPAIRGQKTVRCMMMQPFVFDAGPGSPFNLY